MKVKIQMLIRRIEIWNIWRKKVRSDRYDKLYKLCVLLGLSTSVKFELEAFDYSLKKMHELNSGKMM